METRKNNSGISIHLKNGADVASVQRNFFEYVRMLGVDQAVEALIDAGEQYAGFFLEAEFQHAWTPNCDTLKLCEILGINSLTNDSDLEREIVLTMLASPVIFEYPSFTEFAASVRVRMNIVKAARNTSLAFGTSKIERPVDYWTYSENRGFILLPGKPLIDALQKTTQPCPAGKKYSFSCYRATEYVILLGIALELEERNPELLQRLQLQWEARAIMSRQFHAVFLREHGSTSEPVPLKYFVPGDRVWFRNPDERSSDVAGYEGSWVIYIGGGLFANFWQSDSPYTLESKCIEIYHWRNGVSRKADGDLWIDETVVERHVRASMSDADEIKYILEKMLCPRDLSGIYADGGCMDLSREFPRWLCPGTTDINLPTEF